MKLTFPSRFPLAYVAAFAGAVFVAAWAEGTQLPVAFLAATFLMLSGLAFNIAGGLNYPSGAYVFFVATLDLGVGVLAKIFLGEPLDSHLHDGQKTLLVYNGGMLAILAAVTLNRRLRRERPLLGNLLAKAPTDQIAMGCILIGIAGPLVLPSGLVTIFNQVNNFLPFAVMLPVYTRAKETDGASTFSWVALAAWAYATVVFGLLTFSKQGIFECSAAWALAACAAGYRIGKVRLVITILLAVIATAILTPYSQIGRKYRFSEDLADQAVYLLQHPLETRELYERQSLLEQMTHKTDIRWFDHPQGLLDRLTMVPIDDALISVTDHGQAGTLYTFSTYFMNAIPHFLWPDKPDLNWGNRFAHEIGLLAPGDHSTGIAFSPFSDAYHDGQWLAILIVAPCIFLLLFFVSDSVTGPANQTVWALFYILYFSHFASEGAMASPVYAASTITIGVIVGGWTIARIAPVLGQFVTLPKPPSRQSFVPRP
jgi:hypothetical protein